MVPAGDAPPECVYSFSFHAFTGDAANSKVFQLSKVHNCVLQSAYCFNIKRDCCPSTIRFHVSRSVLSDLLVVGDATGEGAHAMLRKQVKNLGMPLWDEVGPCLPRSFTRNFL